MRDETKLTQQLTVGKRFNNLVSVLINTCRIAKVDALFYLFMYAGIDFCQLCDERKFDELVTEIKKRSRQ